MSKLQFERTINVPAEAVHYALTNAPTLTRWLCNDARVTANVGGRIYFYWNEGYATIGKYTQLEPTTVAFSWLDGSEQKSQVRFDLNEVNGVTTVSVTHTDFAEDSAEEYTKGWEASLENLQSVLETGVDLRLYRRPILGLGGGGNLDADAAAEFGVPQAGFGVNNVITGMGAAEAGLIANDVIIGVNGTDITEWNELAAALNKHQAGDTVDITYYRGAEKSTIPLTLSSQPKPPMPDSLDKLVQMHRDANTQLMAEIRELLADVTEAESHWKSVSPELVEGAEDEWSIREVLGHLIQTEQWAHHFVILTISGQSAPGFNNYTPHIDALSNHDSLADVVDEFERHLHISERLIASLSAEAVARKADMFAFSQTFVLGFPWHSRNHLQTIQTKLAEARADLVPV